MRYRLGETGPGADRKAAKLNQKNHILFWETKAGTTALLEIFPSNATDSQRQILRRRHSVSADASNRSLEKELISIK